MNEIRILTAMQGRQPVVRAFLWQLDYLRAESGLKLPLTIVVSEDEDYDFLTNSGLLTNDCQLVRENNDPLTEKHNAGLRTAMKDKSWDLLLQLGSDDLISLAYIQHLNALKIEENAVYGVKAAYFYNLHLEKMREFAYRGEMQIGAGRAIPRKLIEKAKGIKMDFRRPYFGHLIGDTGYYVEERGKVISERAAGFKAGGKSKITLWSHRKNHGLDGEAWQTLKSLGAKMIMLDDEFEIPQIIDLKTRENITKWERITGRDLSKAESSRVFESVAPEIDL